MGANEAGVLVALMILFSVPADPGSHLFWCLVLPVEYLFNALLGSTVDTFFCPSTLVFRARISGSHLFGVGLA